MADDDTISNLLELYQKCKQKGERASLLMETMDGKHNITFSINGLAGKPADRRKSFPRRWKSPSQIRRDKERREEFFKKKFGIEPAKIEKEEKTKDDEKLVEPVNEICVETAAVKCEKVIVIAKQKINNHNLGIEYNVRTKIEAKNIIVKKVIVERKGHHIHGEFIRCEVLIETVEAKIIEEEDFEIENCWVLPCP